MSSPAVQLLLARLPKEEGERNDGYDDATGKTVRAPVGNLTWGRGYNLSQCASKGLFDVIDRYLIEDIERQLMPYPWYSCMDPVTQSVLLDVAYNAGVAGLLHFPKALAALSAQDRTGFIRELHVADPRLDASRYAGLRAIATDAI